MVRGVGSAREPGASRGEGWSGRSPTAGTGGSVLPIFIFLLCKLIEELDSSDFPTPATPPVLCPFLGFISEVDRGQK